MKIAIDISNTSKHKHRGIGIYSEKLISNLKAIKEPDFSIQLIKEKSNILDVDLIHYPYFDFFSLTLPIIKKKPSVVTIHDVIPLVFPNSFPIGIRGWLKFQIQKLSLKTVKAIITDSENSKEDIIKYLNISKEKIYVVYLAPSFEGVKNKTSLKDKVKKKYKLADKFILYVGDINWNKNIIGLLRAFERISKNIESLKLVLVGQAFSGNSSEAKEINNKIRKLNLLEKTLLTGSLSSEELVSVYQLATIYCQPSFYEGFGLPVLEAMAVGCPVVCSNKGSLPEVAQEAAIYINPYDIDDMSKKMEQLVKNEDRRKELIKKGYSRARKFSWEKTTTATLDIYKKVLRS